MVSTSQANQYGCRSPGRRCGAPPCLHSASERRLHQRATVGYERIFFPALPPSPVTPHPRPLNQRREKLGNFPANGRPALVVEPRAGPHLNTNARNDTLLHSFRTVSCRSSSGSGPARIDNLGPSIATASEFLNRIISVGACWRITPVAPLNGNSCCTTYLSTPNWPSVIGLFSGA